MKKKSNKRDYRASHKQIEMASEIEKAIRLRKRLHWDSFRERKKYEKIKTLRLQHLTLFHCLVFAGFCRSSFFPLSKRFIIRILWSHMLSFPIFGCAVPMILLRLMLMLYRFFLCPTFSWHWLQNRMSFEQVENKYLRSDRYRY